MPDIALGTWNSAEMVMCCSKPMVTLNKLFYFPVDLITTEKVCGSIKGLI